MCSHALDILENSVADELLTFITVFVGSPAHIRNPYLRAKLVEVRTAVDVTNIWRSFPHDLGYL
jgi:hypothetical protein